MQIRIIDIHNISISIKLMKFKNESIVKLIIEVMNRNQNKLKKLYDFNNNVYLSSSLIPGKKLLIE
jgi:hypothetical protein